MIEGIDQTGGENSDKENKHSDFLSNTFLEFVQISAISKKKDSEQVLSIKKFFKKRSKAKFAHSAIFAAKSPV